MKRLHGLLVTLVVAALLVAGLVALIAAQETAPATQPAAAVQSIPGAGSAPPSDAQIRETVSRVRSDMRSVATALESYFIDHNSYPVTIEGGSEKSITTGNALLEGMPTFHRTVGEAQGMGAPFSLTTPIAYLTSYFSDPFNPGGGIGTYSCHTISNGWILVSPGPDGVFDIDPMADYTTGMGQPGPELMALGYDPTNGTVSGGDLFRVRQ
jgi:hypothetical protein